MNPNDCLEHRIGVSKIQYRLEHSTMHYDYVLANIDYGEHAHGQFLGEMDVLAVKGNDLFIFEYKSRHCKKNRYKAKRQLKRAKDFYNDSFDKIVTFYVADKIKYEHIY